MAKVVHCKGCKRQASEMSMGMYDTANDEYFHDQECADAARGIVRDKSGDVVEMGPRYFVKQD